MYQYVFKEAFKDMVKKHVNAAGFKHLVNLQKTHTKAKKMQYGDLNLQQYLESEGNPMTNREKTFAFTARAHMLDLKCNFKFGKDDLKCSLGCDQDETQHHLFVCPALDDDESEERGKYEDIYCNDREKVRVVTRALMLRFQQFLIKKTTVHRTPKPCAATANNNAFVNV